MSRMTALPSEESKSSISLRRKTMGGASHLLAVASAFSCLALWLTSQAGYSQSPFYSGRIVIGASEADNQERSPASAVVSASGDFGSGSGSSQAGNLAASATAWNAATPPRYGASEVITDVEFQDVLHIGNYVGEGRLGLVFTIDRSLNHTTTGNYTTASSYGHLMIDAGSNRVDTTWRTSNGNDGSASSSGSLPFGVPLIYWSNFYSDSLSGTDIILYSYMQVSATAWVNSYESTYAYSQASYSLTFLSVSLETLAGDAISGATFTSSSGFDYNAVPEPTTYVLLGAGALVVVLAARRRAAATRFIGKKLNDKTRS